MCLTTNNSRRLVYQFVVLERMHHEQRKVHAARQIAFEDRVTDVTAPYRQPLAFPLFEVAPPNDSPPSTAGKHPATRLDLVVEIGKAK